MSDENKNNENKDETKKRPKLTVVDTSKDAETPKDDADGDDSPKAEGPSDEFNNAGNGANNGGNNPGPRSGPQSGPQSGKIVLLGTAFAFAALMIAKAVVKRGLRP